MRLSWSEIRTRAGAFARDWAGHGYEKGQTQLFYQGLFEVFGMPVRRVAAFEEPVRQLGDRRGYIDLFWKGVLLVEQKSAGRDLRKARQQALDYFPGLRDDDLPRYLLLSDFQSFELYDLDEGEESFFRLAELPANVEKLGFILGVQRRTFRDQDPVNREAAELIGQLHDSLRASGYATHALERFLVRLVFCLFADDTGIFEPRDSFLDLLEQRTSEDGSDVGPRLTQLFQILNRPEDRREARLDEELRRFPYINGDLFRETLEIPAFDGAMRRQLLAACRFDWSKISPAIFGSLFQSVMDAGARRRLGAHYTTERNILKVVEPLVMDGLRAEFERLRRRTGAQRRTALEAFQRQLGELTFLDPACGSGNFLVIAYRELRLLEMEVLRELRPHMAAGAEQMHLDAAQLSVVNVDQFHGIELDEFAARIAETALWMMDHIMNSRLSLEFGQTYVRIPLRRSPHIVHGNALAMAWETVLPAAACRYVLGNPPFVGHQWRTAEQKADMHRVWGTEGQVNRLDYVTAWFRQAVRYARGAGGTEIAFVATNSITQGEQASILWAPLFAEGAQIRFAHRTFRWDSEAPGEAAVHCVIVGLTFDAGGLRQIYEYQQASGEPHVAVVSRINGYLIEGPHHVIPARSRPAAGRLRVIQGSKPADGARLRLPGGGYETRSNLILDEQDRAELLARAPAAEQWLRPYVGSDELISGRWRWCLWLKDADPAALRAEPEILARLERVRAGRLQSPTESVREYAQFPTLFTQDRQPDVAYLAIPEVSSETREYIPMAMLPPSVIASNTVLIMPGADLFCFGLLTSAMHMAWMRTVGGRLKSDYRYAPTVYNSFPWPELTEGQRDQVAESAAAMLAARDLFPRSSLEVLYDPSTMPPVLRKAHQALDRTVDRLYRQKPFTFERERVEHLFAQFERDAVPLASAAPRRGGRMRRAR